MTEFYVHIGIMSLVASSMLAILMLTKRVTQKWFSASWHYYSSLFLFLLFVVPVYTWLQMSTPVNPAVTIPTGNEVGATLVNYVPIVLLVGSVLFFSVYLFRIVKMTRLLRTTCEESFDEAHLIALAYAKKTLKVKRKVTVYLSPYMTTPFIYGILKPKIVLPSLDFSDEELKHIFLHELTHYKRGDLWTKPLLSIIQSVHWFNPIVHLARREIDRFGEYACDESITKQMNRDERTRYCELLLNVLWNVVDQKHGHYAAMSQDRKSLERRMKTVLATRGKRQRTALISGSMFTLILAVAGTTVGLTADAHTSAPHVVADDAQLVEDRMDGETQMSDDPLVESDLKDENFEND